MFLTHVQYKIRCVPIGHITTPPPEARSGARREKVREARKRKEETDKKF